MYRLFLFCLIIAFLSCQNNREQAPQETQGTETDLSEFYTFYQQFHQDSLFQVAHITWPLEGYPNHAGMDSTFNRDQKYYWQKENWTMHRPIDYEMSEFKRRLTPITEDLIFEEITHKSGHYGMIRRWAKLSDGWHLIYYVGMNRMGEGT